MRHSEGQGCVTARGGDVTVTQRGAGMRHSEGQDPGWRGTIRHDAVTG
jgi:hypothetical protein